MMTSFGWVGRGKYDSFLLVSDKAMGGVARVSKTKTSFGRGRYGSFLLVTDKAMGGVARVRKCGSPVNQRIQCP